MADQRSDILTDGSVSPDFETPILDSNGRQDSSDVVILDSRGKAMDGKTTLYVWMATFVAALGGILFGYDIGIIGGAILQLKDVFNLSCPQQELVVSCLLIGAIFGSIFGGFVVDYCGRKKAIIFNSCLFVVGALVMAMSQELYSLLVGRLIIGFATSVSATAECVYISEIAPAARRGALVSLNELAIAAGILIAYLVNYLLMANTVDGWRYMFGLSIVPAVVQGVSMLFLPPSPRYLVLRNKEQQALEILKKVRGHDNVNRELTSIRAAITTENHKLTDLFRSADNMRFRMVIAFGLVFAQQFTGQPTLLLYAPTLFQLIGFTSRKTATLATVILGVVKLVATLVSVFCVDHAGRRRILLIGATTLTTMTFAFFVLTLIDGLDVVVSPCVDMTHLNHTAVTHGNMTVPRPLPEDDDEVFSHHLVFKSTNMATAMKWMLFIVMTVYTASYACSFGPATWLVLSEIFPAGIKGRAMSLATTINWIGYLLVSVSFLDLVDTLTVPVVFFIYTVTSAISVVFIFTSLPETKQKTLEQISVELNRTCFMNQFRKHLAIRWSEITRPCIGRDSVRLDSIDDEDVVFDITSRL